jgi:ketosteroid isomerase-like protein
MTSLLLVLLAASTLSQDARVDSLLVAERSFAARSAACGPDSAFLAFLADDAVLLRPYVVNGKHWIRNHRSNNYSLLWSPAFGEVSAAGDLGYTTGPWKILDSAGTLRRVGHFVSLWRKQADGQWKVVFDLGVGHSRGDEPSWPSPRVAARARRKFVAEKEGVKLRQLDSLANDKYRDVAHYLRDVVAADVKAFRPGSAPAIGRKAALTLLKPLLENESGSPLDVRIAASGDLAYSYGTMPGTEPDLPGGYYLKVWRWEGKWRVVLDIVNKILI